MSQLHGDRLFECRSSILVFSHYTIQCIILGQSLDPELNGIMSSSHDSAQLRDVWKGWRDQSGKKIRNLYKEFVKLVNKGATQYGKTGTFFV